jgi:hypothetical protein
MNIILNKLRKCSLLSEVLKQVTHRHWIFSIAKCEDNAVPSASIVVQTYGDFLNFNPHLQTIVSDGCFLDDHGFRMAPGLRGRIWKKPSSTKF